jgi:hypothetical protein
MSKEWMLAKWMLAKCLGDSKAWDLASSDHQPSSSRYCSSMAWKRGWSRMGS